MKISYDEKCYELAQHFLEDEATDKDLDELAQAIQTAVENWLNEEF